jgi:hypothetical protein
MSFQVVIGSNPDEFDKLEKVRDLLAWNTKVLTQTYGTDFNEHVPVTSDELESLYDWINGLCTLITNVGFAIEESSPLEIQA